MKTSPLAAVVVWLAAVGLAGCCDLVGNEYTCTCYAPAMYAGDAGACVAPDASFSYVFSCTTSSTPRAVSGQSCGRACGAPDGSYAVCACTCTAQPCRIRRNGCR